MNAVPVSVALVAGGLAVINPCGFPLLPAFFFLLSRRRRRHAPARTDADHARAAGRCARRNEITVEACVTVVSRSTPSAPITIPASNRPRIETWLVACR